MERTRVKICGITRPQDAVLAAAAGADAIGLNFVGGPRKIDIKTADAILRVLPPLVGTVALINMDPEQRGDDFYTLRERLTIRYFQLYGSWDEIGFSDGIIAATGLWPVVRVAAKADVMNLAIHVRQWNFPPAAIVLDAFSPEKQGGAGMAFDWNWIAEARAAGILDQLPPLVLGGGLNPDNVGEAIRIARPWAVDVSSGVEIPSQPGKKDPVRLQAFMQAVVA
ncbi:MAG: phosphoribosylanthranilate isomerase [Planctomycetes bacterium]|jgi:phosphoribosylanthranilate isomerase|nr:phosphoribosylanthranilate isomerase [Planctomycetota bacterium]